MNQSSEAAEQIVRMSLEGFEMVAKVTGTGAKNVGALLYAVMKDNQKSSGKTRLTNMLKSGKPLKVFSVKQSELKKFQEEAKRYGVLYCALINRKDKTNDGLVDVMVRAEDAGKIDRIVDRFKLSSYNKVEIIEEINKDKAKLNQQEAKTDKSPLSRRSSKSKDSSERVGSNKPSVREQLNKYKNEIKNKDKATKEHVKVKMPKSKER